MSDPTDIRKQLIRLGEANPALRENIKPVLDRLKQAQASKQAAAAPEYVALDKAISQWARQTKSKLNRGDVRVDVLVETEGIQRTNLHPSWSITITYWYDEVEPSTRVLSVSGDAHHTDEVEVSRYDYDLPNGRMYNLRSKDLYDWSPRDVLALLDRYL